MLENKVVLFSLTVVQMKSVVFPVLAENVDVLLEAYLQRQTLSLAQSSPRIQ